MMLMEIGDELYHFFITPRGFGDRTLGHPSRYIIVNDTLGQEGCKISKMDPYIMLGIKESIMSHHGGKTRFQF